ncbi:MAG: ABC transporter permease subunit [Alphaproteobacteria bacterium]|nr:ABC transporter permease subunit [Alphaproteobacteria bacterium]
MAAWRPLPRPGSAAPADIESGVQAISAATRRTLIGLPFVWLAVFFLLPLGIITAISLTESADTIPPFRPLLSTGAHGVEWHGTLANYADLAQGCLRVYVSSLANAGLATLLCLMLGFPMALAIARAPGMWRHFLLFLVMLPFWTSFLIRVYAWIALLQPSGLINRVLLATGLIEAPLPLLYNEFSVALGLVYSYLPFMILPLYGSLSRLDPSLVEASADLGARPWRVLWQVIVPLTQPGIAAGALLVFIPAVGEFVIPDLLGGPNTLMVGRLLWQEFFDNVDWPAASAMAVALVALLTLPLVVAPRLLNRETAP